MDFRYALLFVLLLAPFASAQPNASQIKAGGLESAMENVECQVEFMTGVISSVMEHVNGTQDLGNYIDTLETDVSNLQGYADSGDMTGFRTYVHGTFAENMRDARRDIIEARVGPGVTPAIRSELRSDYDSLKEEFQSCSFDSLKRYTQARVNAYEVALNKAEERAERLESKGVDTSGLTSLISDAGDQIVDPLKEALNVAQNGTDVRDAIYKYCLFNGCKDGINFHFGAKFEAEKLDSILSSINGNATEKGLGAEVESAQEDIDAAQSTLESAGTSQYSEGQGQGLWERLRDAADTIKGILSSLRSG